MSAALSFDPKTSDRAYFIVLDGSPVASPCWTRDAAETAERIALTYGELADDDGHELEVLCVDEDGNAR